MEEDIVKCRLFFVLGFWPHVGSKGAPIYSLQGLKSPDLWPVGSKRILP